MNHLRSALTITLTFFAVTATTALLAAWMTQALLNYLP